MPSKPEYLKDEMTPNERMMAYMTGQPLDRIPCVPLINCHAATLIGCSVRDYLLNSRLMANGQIAAYKLYNHDSLGLAPGQHVVAGAMGGKIDYPEDNMASMAEHPLTDEATLDRLRIPDATKDGDLPIYLEALRMIVEAVGKEVGTGVILAGPLSTAASVYGTDRLLKSMLKRPEFTHRMLEFVLLSLVAVGKQFIKEGAQIVVVDPIASGSLIGAQQARDFAFPYSAKLIAELKPLCPGIILHICGDTSKLLECMADTGAVCLSLDNIVDLEMAKKRVGSRVTLAGNVSPVDVMLRGTPADVKCAAKECLRKAYDSPHGFLLSSGCDLPIKTPPENILALMEAARTYGKWPINPELLNS